MRVLVIGATGQVARALAERARQQDLSVVLVGRPDLDLAVPASIARTIEAAPCDIVVNAAAYTAVDQAESDEEAAHRVNAVGPGLLAAAAARKGVPIIQLSTDYVFDGRADEPYREDHAVAPVSVYGRTKLAGEIAVQDANQDWVILRTAWVYSPFGKNFVKTMLRLAADRDEISVVDDQQGSPTSALDIADAILAVSRNLMRGREDASLRGVFHLAGAGFTTWAGLAAYVFQLSGQMGGPSARVRPIRTAEYPTPARRPLNSRLDTSKLAAVHGVQLPDWRQSVSPCVQRLIQELATEAGR